jgi:hypothetical protein
MKIYTPAVPSALREANSKVDRLVLPAQVADVNGPSKSYKQFVTKEMLVGAVGIELLVALKTRKLLIL